MNSFRFVMIAFFFTVVVVLMQYKLEVQALQKSHLNMKAKSNMNLRKVVSSSAVVAASFFGSSFSTPTTTSTPFASAFHAGVPQAIAAEKSVFAGFYDDPNHPGKYVLLVLILI